MALKLYNRDECRRASVISTKKWARSYRHELAQRAEALDPDTSTDDDIADIVGHRGGIFVPECDECGYKGWDVPVVQMGEEEDYESRTADLCANCLRKALAMMEER